MSNPIDQIEIKFKDGSPLWVYIQELVPLSTPDGTVVSYTANRIPIEPSDPRVQEYIGAAAAAAIESAQKLTDQVEELQAKIAELTATREADTTSAQ